MPGVFKQPLAGMHESIVQLFASSQFFGLPSHMPALQVVCTWQRLALTHAVPWVTKLLVQLPSSHESIVQGLLSLQSLLETHVHPLGLFIQPTAGLHESTVHELPSSQLMVSPP
jgi:hypothetical protein